jgi:hypothetical protein
MMDERDAVDLLKGSRPSVVLTKSIIEPLYAEFRLKQLEKYGVNVLPIANVEDIQREVLRVIRDNMLFFEDSREFIINSSVDYLGEGIVPAEIVKLKTDIRSSAEKIRRDYELPD